MRIFISILALFLCDCAQSQSISAARNLTEAKGQWLAQYLLHYDSIHFHTPFYSQQDFLLRESLYPSTYEGKPEVYLLAALCDFYFPLFKKSIRQHQLPEDLQYLPAVMSGCNPRFSANGRAGLWGLTLADAKQIGLRVDGDIDERRGGDFTTEAWCKELGKRFGQQDLSTILISLYGELEGLRLAEDIHRIKAIFAEMRTQNFLSVCMDAFALTSPIRFDEDCSLLALGAISGVDTSLIRQLNPIFTGSHFPSSEKRTTLIFPIQRTPLLEQRRALCSHYNPPSDFVQRRINHHRKLQRILAKYWVSPEELLFYNGLGMKDVWSTPPALEAFYRIDKKIRIPIFKVN